MLFCCRGKKGKKRLPRILELEFQPPPLSARSGDLTERRRQRERQQRRHSKTKVHIIFNTGAWHGVRARFTSFRTLNMEKSDVLVADAVAIGWGP